MFPETSNRVYFLHGYFGPGFEMRKILKAVEKEGYDCTLFTYRSLLDEIDSIGKDLIRKILSDKVDNISFITHSMGALVVRSIFEHVNTIENFPSVQRIVMIAPPNNGTPIADFYNRFQFSKFLLGPNLKNLTTDPKSGAAKYPIPSCEIGLITGILAGSKKLNIFMKCDNDGILAPEQERLGNEKDIINIGSSHFGLLYNKTVIENVISFLKYGVFASK